MLTPLAPHAAAQIKGLVAYVKMAWGPARTLWNWILRGHLEKKKEKELTEQALAWPPENAVKVVFTSTTNPKCRVTLWSDRKKTATVQVRCVLTNLSPFDVTLVKWKLRWTARKRDQTFSSEGDYNETIVAGTNSPSILPKTSTRTTTLIMQGTYTGEAENYDWVNLNIDGQLVFHAVWKIWEFPLDVSGGTYAIVEVEQPKDY
jgi:hypothetical protein